MSIGEVIVNKKMTDDDRRVICKALEQYNRGANVKEFYLNIIWGLTKTHNIKINRWVNGDYGYCYYDDRSIDIPRPTSLARFLTCLHEIGHIVVDKKTYPTWKSEYLCMKFEFDFCTAYGIKVDEKAKKRNRNYMRQVVVDCIKSGTDINDIDPEVIKMANIKLPVWKRKLKKGFLPKVIKVAARQHKIKWTLRKVAKSKK